MGRNLFYDLPIELINLVYKQYHTNYVLKQLLTRPGNFSFMDTDWADILEQDYRVVDNIPGAWEFLRVCDYNFIMYANRRNVIFKKIYIFYSLSPKMVGDYLEIITIKNLRVSLRGLKIISDGINSETIRIHFVPSFY
jgi:hypothetical protein